MKRSLNDLVGYTIRAKDGEIGTVQDFFFDDHDWTIRYMVVDTGGLVNGYQVLISPVALEKPEWETRAFPVDLTMEQVRNSPSVDTKKPLSRKNEADLIGHYGWPLYWTFGSYGNVGATGYTMESTTPAVWGTGKDSEIAVEEPEEESHLRAASQVTGYCIHATDGEIGHVVDFMVEEESWDICYMLVDTGGWLPGKKVLVSPKWIKHVSWADSCVFLDVTRESIKNSPKFDPSKPIDSDYEGELHDYYGKPLE